MPRRSGPTLYEAMSRTAAHGSTAPTPKGRRTASPEHDRPVPPTLLTPGSAIRLPVGYVWVIGIGILALTIGAYLLGHSKGVAAGQAARQESEAAADRVARETSRIREPEAAGTDESLDRFPSGAPRSSAEASAPRTSARLVVPGGIPADPASRPSDVLKDRRRSGDTYYQIITTTFDDARRTAELVSVQGASMGLDAQVVRGDTDKLASVILHPGFRSQSEEDEDQWERVIRELGSRMVGKLKLKKPSDQPFSDFFKFTHP